MKLKLKFNLLARPNTAMTIRWFRNYIGEKRWKKVEAYVKLKYGTKKMYLGYHKKGGGPELYVMLPNGDKHIGSFGDVEAKAKRKKK